MGSSISEEEHGIFRSERLVYRAPESSDDLGLFKKLTFDRVGYVLSSYSNNRLAGLDDAAGYRKAIIDRSYIAAVICLPPSARTSTTADSSSNSESTDLTPIGEIHLKNFGADRAHHRSGEIGLQILMPYQQRGYGTEAIQWLLNWAFHHTGLHRVGIRTLESNTGAIRCYVKCGFKEEGREREAIWQDGRWHDIVCMSLLEGEWRDMQKARAES